MKIVVIDYGMGNVNSVAKGFNKVGAEVIISNKPKDLEQADAIVLPGVGAFGDGMNNLRKLGFVEILNNEVLKKNKPFLGICLGMQLISRISYEKGIHPGLNWIRAETRLLDTGDINLKIPHMGWNEIILSPSNLSNIFFDGVPDKTDLYFVHSYCVDCEEDIVIAKCKYGVEFAAAIHKKNIFACQFHPEKSQSFGLMILKNFVRYCENVKM